MRGRCAAWVRGRRAHRPALPALLLLSVASACVSQATPQRHGVELTAFTFSPDTVRAVVGDTIEWLNRDVVPHTATAADGAWDSGAVAPQGSWSWVVDASGAFTYVCTLHPSMSGVILVR